MGYQTITIEPDAQKRLMELFEGLSDIQAYQLQVVHDVLSDGVIDDRDAISFSLTRQELGDLKKFKDGEFYNQRRGQELVAKSARNIFFRQLYYHIRCFSALDENKQSLSADEVGQFQKSLSDTSSAGAKIYTENLFTVFNREVLFLHQSGHPWVISDDALVVVTHPSYGYDSDGVAQKGIDQIIGRTNEEGIKTIYLLSRWEHFQDFYLHEMLPVVFVHSQAGEHNIQFEGNNLILMGGYFLLCLEKTFSDVFKHRKSTRHLTVTLPIEAIYYDPKNKILLKDYLAQFPKGQRKIELEHLITTAHGYASSSGEVAYFLDAEPMSLNPEKPKVTVRFVSNFALPIS